MEKNVQLSTTAGDLPVSIEIQSLIIAAGESEPPSPTLLLLIFARCNPLREGYKPSSSSVVQNAKYVDICLALRLTQKVINVFLCEECIELSQETILR